MPSPLRKKNGSRWRSLEARVLAEETHCALCDQYVDKSLDRKTDPLSAAIDHDIPLHRGGPEYDRSNLRLMHRGCNRWKSTMTLAEARAKKAGIVKARSEIVASPGW
ncbi:HNH endonuclease [Oerskovia sp. NPDC060338]|uniref:HNH endonuclease n=1 Tax=Oerskovia sp. NPDC060338 TaxID=3347100 RepID=UPI003662E1C7